MEESANEKIQENPKVETEEDEEVKRVVVNFVEEEEINPEISSSKDIDVVENSVKETNLEEEVEEGKDGPLENLGVSEDGENKNELSGEKDEHSVLLVDESDSVVEVSVENSKDSEVAEVEETGEKVVCRDEINGIALNVKEVVLDEDEETPKLAQSLDESDKGESQVILVSSETDEIKAHPSEEKNELSSIATDVVAKEIEESNLPSLDENCEASLDSTDAVSKETDERALQSLEDSSASASRRIEDQKVLSSSKSEAEAPGIVSNDGFPESPIISLRQRTVQRTSWSSCCGLFEVLRRSDT